MHLVAASGENLVRVALVSDIPDDAIVRGVVEIVQCDGELDRAETGREVTARTGDALDEVSAQLPGYVAQRPLRQTAEIRRRPDRTEQGIVVSHTHVRANESGGRLCSRVYWFSLEYG